jgi:hypothetical protein
VLSVYLNLHRERPAPTVGNLWPQCHMAEERSVSSNDAVCCQGYMAYVVDEYSRSKENVLYDCDKGKPSTRGEKTNLLPFFPPQIPRRVIWDRNGTYGFEISCAAYNLMWEFISVKKKTYECKRSHNGRMEQSKAMEYGSRKASPDVLKPRYIYKGKHLVRPTVIRLILEQTANSKHDKNVSAGESPKIGNACMTSHCGAFA